MKSYTCDIRVVISAEGPTEAQKILFTLMELLKAQAHVEVPYFSEEE